MSEIKEINCNMFKTKANVLLHQVNCQGVMGSGVALQVRKNFPNTYEFYKGICDVVVQKEQLLGEVLFSGENGVMICNLFAQEKYGHKGVYTDYKALRECLTKVNDRLKENDIVALPYLMGCDRGGGDWTMVKEIIEETLTKGTILICKYP